MTAWLGAHVIILCTIQSVRAYPPATRIHDVVLVLIKKVFLVESDHGIFKKFAHMRALSLSLKESLDTFP